MEQTNNLLNFFYKWDKVDVYMQICYADFSLAMTHISGDVYVFVFVFFTCVLYYF